MTVFKKVSRKWMYKNFPLTKAICVRTESGEDIIYIAYRARSKVRLHEYFHYKQRHNDNQNCTIMEWFFDECDANKYAYENIGKIPNYKICLHAVYEGAHDRLSPNLLVNMAKEYFKTHQITYTQEELSNLWWEAKNEYKASKKT